MNDFGKYLIDIGVHSNEFMYDAIELYDNIDYFYRCFEFDLSTYKALLFLHDYVHADNKDEWFTKPE